jgi:hypothetical protein
MDRDRWQAVINTLRELLVQKINGNFLTGWKTVSFSRSALLLGDT